MWVHAGEKQRLDFEEGEIILVNKPIDWTSFDVVARIRTMFEIKKVGHAGTLDPKATGLLIVCTGKMTKNIDSIVGLEKEYTGAMELGSRTKSFDSETEIFETNDISLVDENKIHRAMESFLGKQQQLPPMYSAIKKNGRRLYKDARKGKEVSRSTREIEIKAFNLIAWNPPLAEFRVVCSKGTYIRALANDLGETLGCGAYLKRLTRTMIGDFSLSDALGIDQLHTLNAKLHPVVPQV